MPFNKTWSTMDDHGPVPMDVHGHPWSKAMFFRRGRNDEIQDDDHTTLHVSNYYIMLILRSTNSI